MTTTARVVAGIAFRNPILLASGTAGYGRELSGVVDLDGIGGLVTKAVSLEPRHGNRAPRVAEFHGGMLNSVGLANPGVSAVLRDELPWLEAHHPGLPVLMNVVGFEIDEYAEVIRRTETGAGPAGYELNLSCPNTAAGGLEFGADERSLRDVVTRCRSATSRPVFVKLSPVLPDVAAMGRTARDAGADGLTLVNTMPGFLSEGGTPRLGNGAGGMSGPALRPVGLLAVRRTAAALPGFPIIGAGGIVTVDHVREYLDAGASLVEIGTAALADPRLPQRLVDELEHRNG
ncbi:MAG TPA: dihydroorotate dehydrogenase [Gemmatimonadales bacterium]